MNNVKALYLPANRNLKPCAYCGSSDVAMLGNNRGIFFYCNNCGAETHFKRQENQYLMGLITTNDSADTEALFIGAWNRRFND